MPRTCGTYIVVLAALLALLAPSGASAQDLLPDLDQEVPSRLSVKKVELGGKRSFRLGFRSAAANVGDGPLRLFGYRASESDPTMDVNQFVAQAVGKPRTVRNVGVMSYVVHPDHKHWHLLGFEKYEIRAAGDAGAVLRRDRKTGFCLGDRYALPNASAFAAFRPAPAFPEECGLGEPDSMGIFAGISVGYGDNYEPQVEGQYVDVTGMPAGDYVLTHTLNTNGKLAERDTTNNAASVLFSLAWPKGRNETPRVRVLRRCPSSPDCSQSNAPRSTS